MTKVKIGGVDVPADSLLHYLHQLIDNERAQEHLVAAAAPPKLTIDVNDRNVINFVCPCCNTEGVVPFAVDVTGRFTWTDAVDFVGLSITYEPSDAEPWGHLGYCCDSCEHPVSLPDEWTGR